MNVASPPENLKRLRSEIRSAFVALGEESIPSRECILMAQSLPLTCAMTSATFGEVAADKKQVGWKLLCPSRLDQLGIRRLRPESAESVLGTAKFVFLYCGQFRYPETQVGFLFATRLEADPKAVCEASPFDSGALHRKVTWPEAADSAIAFLARHTLPAPAYRDYLADRLHFLFRKPEDYVKRKETFRADPLGLVTIPPRNPPDPRSWTFELRVADEVNLSAPHLAVVFYPRRLRREAPVRNFLAGLGDQVEVQQVVMADDGDFAALQRHCLDFLRKKRIISEASV